MMDSDALSLLRSGFGAALETLRRAAATKGTMDIASPHFDLIKFTFPHTSGSVVLVLAKLRVKTHFVHSSPGGDLSGFERFMVSQIKKIHDHYAAMAEKFEPGEYMNDVMECRMVPKPGSGLMADEGVFATCVELHEHVDLYKGTMDEHVEHKKRVRTRRSR